MSLPTPITRKESYLAAIAGEQVQVPEKPITREEAYLDAIAKGGGGGEIIVDPVPTEGSENAVSSGGTYTALEGKLDASEKGTASGVAELDANGKVLSSQLPSFVDDVVEGYYDSVTDRFYEESTFENVIDPVEGKLWVDIPANKSYRWTGTVYVRVDEGVQLGETSNSAFRGDWGKTLKETMGTGTLDTEAQTVIGAVNELKGAMPTDLADLEGDSTHRTVTDTEKAEWSGKQDSLTFDTTPTEDSENPVTSGGIKTAIDDSVSLKTATGNPITLTDAANANAEGLLMTIEPIQSGSGDPSPTNVRPISGISTASVQTTNGTDTNTATITLGQTVYGGSVNFKTGEVTVTHALVDMGTLPFNYTGVLFYVILDAIGAKRTNDAIEDIKASIYYNGGIRGVATISEYMIATNIDRYFYINDPRANTVAELVELISGQTLCYELATPTTLTLTPAELELLKGNNTITANGAEISIEYYPDNAIGALAEKVDNKADITYVDNAVNGKVEIQNNAGFHNSIYRGKYLGSEVTAAQYAAIEAGTFDDMFIGDFWTIGGVNYRIAHFNYWLGSGDTECIIPHELIVPDTKLYDAKMNDSNVTTGAYVGSKMYTENLAAAKTTINNAFGANHILSHREYLANAMKATADPTYESAAFWYTSTVELMNERMVYGADVFHNVEANGAIPNNNTIDMSQLALFALDHSNISNRENWWLRDAVSAENFAFVSNVSRAGYAGAGDTIGVRPAFGIIG